MGRMEKAWRKKADWKRRRECSGKEKRGGRAYVKRGLGQLEGVTLGCRVEPRGEEQQWRCEKGIVKERDERKKRVNTTRKGMISSWSPRGVKWRRAHEYWGA